MISKMASYFLLILAVLIFTMMECHIETVPISVNKIASKQIYDLSNFSVKIGHCICSDLIIDTFVAGNLGIKTTSHALIDLNWYCILESLCWEMQRASYNKAYDKSTYNGVQWIIYEPFISCLIPFESINEIYGIYSGIPHSGSTRAGASEYITSSKTWQSGFENMQQRSPSNDVQQTFLRLKALSCLVFGPTDVWYTSRYGWSILRCSSAECGWWLRNSPFLVNVVFLRFNWIPVFPHTKFKLASTCSLWLIIAVMSTISSAKRT